ncbi:hypothetical protein C9J21_17960, partial [Photobacterium phosphoreum]|uniref:MobH family relaxase n=1 Tax=Photobacterium phosphoreum TaxID=659 RepID=UPI000D44A05A
MGIFKRKNSQKQNQLEMDSTNSNQYSSNIDPTKPESSGFYIARSSDYWLDKHKHVISLINSNCRLADYHFKMYYIQAIRNFCNLAQAFPASEYHHHSYPGGLIEHSLDVAKSAVIYARKFLYTESNKETEIEETLDVFMYCCFCAALMHDAGKIVTDLDVVYINKEAEVCAWLPFGNTILSDGTKYKWRYSPVRNKSAHESAAPSLIQSIIPFEGLYWMRSRTPTLWQFWLHTIAGRSKLGGDIGKVIEFCDSNSVQKSMNPSSSKDGQGSNTRHTLAERFLTAFRQIIESGSLPLNRKGAGGWVSGDYIYLVSQRAVDSAIPVVKNAGGTGIPQNDVTIFSMLCDAGVAERHSVTNDVIHSMKVTLEDGWTGDLTFLKISKDILDPNGVLGLVDGKITLSDLTQDKGYNAKRDKKAAADSNNASTPNDVVKNDDFNSVSSDLMNQAFLDDEKKEPLNIDPSMGSSLSGSLDSMFGSLQKNKPIKPKIKADGPKVDVAMESKPDENTTTGGLFDDMTFNDLKADAHKADVAVESKPDENTTTGGLFDDMTFNDLKADAPKVDVAVESKPDENTTTGGLFDDMTFNDLKADAPKVDVAVESKPDE